jgi:L-lysine 6-transaminase
MVPEDVHKIIKNHTIGDGEPIVVSLERSNKCHITDALTGKRYLDCSSQYASLPLGWNHEKLLKRMSNIHVSIISHKIANSDFYTRSFAEFVETFASITPDFKYLFFIEGGALGVENAIKAAFDWKAKKLGITDVNCLDIIHLKQSFHGRSGYTLSLTNTVENKTALFPKFNWTRIKNPKVEGEVATDEELSLAQAENALKSGKVAAIVLETIQGEGGDNHFTPKYFAALRQLADKYEALLILDEVQTGVGLTGKMWAYEHFGIIPDMISFGKKTQVCGFASTVRIDTVPENVFHVSSRINSTWGGNIVDMVRFTHIAAIIKEDNLLENARIVGDYFLEKLREVPKIQNIRGKGLMLAFDLKTTADRDIILKNMQNHMSVLPCGERSIRLRPSLIFSKDNVDEAIIYIKESIENS